MSPIGMISRESCGLAISLQQILIDGAVRTDQRASDAESIQIGEQPLGRIAKAGLGLVADVRYDRTWISRLSGTIRAIRGVGLIVILLLAVASAMTVANVVRLTAMARRHEIEIMQLVGAPFAYIRGPFIAEGLIQGGVGALCAVVLLLVTFAGIRARYGGFLAEAIGLTGVAFVPTQLLLLLVVGGMALGCVGGFIVARAVR